jgi:hypothetical protein
MWTTSKLISLLLLLAVASATDTDSLFGIFLAIQNAFISRLVDFWMQYNIAITAIIASLILGFVIGKRHEKL